ncbi:hypothetical protein HYW58_02450 [Candidatus Kaiserbacteria bacterium]|nr:hypothetical protein [Candidatus Kaiserbacteria bacterium]
MLRNVLRFVTALAVAIFAMVAIPTTTFAGTPDEDAFKELLVKQSPWDVSWENQSGAKGTHKLRFKKDGAALSGEFFGSDRGSADLPLKNLTVTSSCVKFITGQNPRTYNYCLKDGILTGDYEGQSRSGNWYTGKATGKPTGK